MEISVIILKQTLIMAAYMMASFYLFKKGKITLEGCKSMATILLWVVVPCVIVNSLCMPMTKEKLGQMGFSVLLGAASLAISVAAARLLFPKVVIEECAAEYANAGYLGIPLVRACFGEEAVSYLVGIIVTMNLIQWTYGASRMSHGKAKMGIKQMVLNPVMLAVVIGLTLFLTGWGTQLPDMVKNGISGMAALNGPLAMLVLGVYLGRTDLKKLLTNKRLYVISGVRLLVIPAITAGVFCLIPADTTVRLAVLTAACGPVGANVAVYAQLYDEDYSYACQAVAQSTVLAVAVMPLMLAFGNMLMR